MQPRPLVDDLLVVVAPRVRRWAERILSERDGTVPMADHDFQGGDGGDELDSPDGEGPPAHWLEMVRARAPQLLSPEQRSPRRSPPSTRERSSSRRASPR